MSIVNNDITELMLKVLRKALDSLEIQDLPEEIAAYHELQVLVSDMAHINQFALALAKGDLSQKITVQGRLAGYLKAIQTNNCHLNWQAQMVAQGDLTQRVDYMGDFSESFNSMVDSLVKTDKSLRNSEENLRQIIEVMPILVSIFRWSDQTLLYANRKINEVFLLTLEEVIGQRIVNIWVDPADRIRYYKTLENDGVVKNFECQFIRKNGDVFWALLNAAMIEYQGDKAILSTVYDIQERKGIEQELKRLATTDTLTGVPNRRSFFEMAEQDFKRVRRYKNLVAFLILDIDHFKNINDNYGHQGGDEVLRVFVQVCKEELREADVFGRIGGEEFAILLPETNQSSARLVAERIRQKIEQMIIPFEEYAIKITVSIGVATIAITDKSLDQVFQRADTALYEAKNSGRNRVVG
jgi:diguanylate cyclase (GGDEF)-like protein/PAS domain S-box-containing protein